MEEKYRELGRRYELKPIGGPSDLPDKTEFRASGPEHALLTAQRLMPGGGSALVLENGEPLAEISYSADGFWIVSPPTPEPAR